MEQRRVHGAEAGDARGGGEQAGRPGDGLQRLAVQIGVAAVALPAPDRQHEVDAGVVAHLGERKAILPARRPASGTLVAERPDEQLAPNRPSFSALALYIARRSRWMVRDGRARLFLRLLPQPRPSFASPVARRSAAEGRLHSRRRAPQVARMNSTSDHFSRRPRGCRA